MSDDLNQGTCVRSNGDEQRDRGWSEKKKSTRERKRETAHKRWKADAPQERSLRCSTQKMAK